MRPLANSFVSILLGVFLPLCGCAPLAGNFPIPAPPEQPNPSGSALSESSVSASAPSTTPVQRQAKTPAESIASNKMTREIIEREAGSAVLETLGCIRQRV